MSALPIGGAPGGVPLPNFTGGASGPALSDSFLSDYGILRNDLFNDGSSFRSDFNVGGPGFLAGAGSASIPWGWLLLAAVGGLFIWRASA